MHTQNQASDAPNQLTGGISLLHSEQTLFRQAQTGCRDCLNKLMEKHKGLVHAVVRKQFLGNLPYAEAVQAGRIGLWHAILGYDPQRGYAFSTYAWPSIARRVWRAVKKASRFHSPSGIAAHSPAVWELSPPVLWEAFLVRLALYDLVKRLPARLRKIVVLRYGLAGNAPPSYRELGRRMELSRERVRQLHTEALVWLRHPAHSQQLRSLLGRHRVADYEAADAQAQRWLRKRGGQDA